MGIVTVPVPVGVVFSETVNVDVAPPSVTEWLVRALTRISRVSLSWALPVTVPPLTPS